MITLQLSAFHLIVLLTALLGYIIITINLIINSGGGSMNSSLTINQLNNEIDKLRNRATKAEQYSASILSNKKSINEASSTSKLAVSSTTGDIIHRNNNVEYSQGVIILGKVKYKVFSVA